MNCIKDLRKIRGLNQTALGEMVGVSQAHIARIERGDMGVTLKVYSDIATALNVSLHALFMDGPSQAEVDLLAMYRDLSEDRRKGWHDALVVAKADAPKEDQ